MNSRLEKGHIFPRYSSSLREVYLDAQTHLQCQCRSANSMQGISSGAKQFGSLPLIFPHITNSWKHVYSALYWMIPKTIFLGPMPSFNSWSTAYFLTSSLGGNILHHLHCHLPCLILHLTSKDNFSLPSSNLLLPPLGKWLLQYFEHLLCLEPIIPTIYHRQTSLPSWYIPTSAFQRLSHWPTLFSFTTLLFQSSASWLDSLHKNIIQSWRTIWLHFKSGPHQTSGKW